MKIMLPVDSTGLGKMPVNESREPAVSSAPSYMLTKSLLHKKNYHLYTSAMLQRTSLISYKEKQRIDRRNIYIP